MVRRGSTGDDSGNDFGGGGYDNETSAGSGVTGDSGSDTSYGGGGYDSGGSSPSAGDSGTESSDFGGGGGDDDSDYDPNPSDRSTGGDSDLNDITGGRNYGEKQPQSTGDSPSRNQGGAGGSGTGSTSGDAESASDSGDDSSNVDVEVGETSDRGVGVTRGPEGTEVVVPAGEPVQQSVREARQTRRAETRAAVNRFGQRQLDALRASQATNGAGRAARTDSLIHGLVTATGIQSSTYRDAAGFADWAAGSVDEYVGQAEMNRNITDDLTQSGGLFPEARGGPLGISEQDLRNRAEQISGYKETIETDEGGVPDAQERLPEQVLEGVAKTGLDFLNVPQHVQSIETGIEITQNAPGAVREYGAGAVAGTATAVTRETGEAMVRDFSRNPVEFLAGAGFSYLTGVAVSRTLGKVGRSVKDRVRTAGGEKVDAEDITNEGTVDYYEGRSQSPEDKFPGAENPDLYKTSPAEAVRRQAERYTPSPVEEFFRDYGITEGTTLKKAIEVEPEGPGVNRGPQKSPGFETQEGDYESPGAFAGPEFSPNFLGLDGYGGFSPRPGLPDFGNNPTGVLVRTDVREPDADTMDEFNRELVDERAGETTARTKPAESEEFNTGEIEAVIPPEARFERVGSGIRGLAERFGLGSRFYTEIGGRRVPLRPVAPEDRVDTDAGDVAPDSRGGRPSGETLDYYVESPEQPVDRPLPPAGPGGGASAGSQGGQPRDPYGTGAVEQDLRDLYDERRITGRDRQPSSRSDSQRDRGRRSKPSDTRDTSRDRDSSRTSGDSRRRTDSRRSRPTDSGRRITEPSSNRRPGDSRGESYGGGSSSDRRGGGSSGGSYPPSDVPQPPRYPSYPPTSPSITESIPTPTYPTPDVPYPPSLRPRPERQGDEKVEKQEFSVPFGFWDRAWVNPVASAQTAWTRTLGGAGQTQVGGLGSEEMLGAVREDIERYR